MKRVFDCIRRPHNPAAPQYTVPTHHLAAEALPKSVDMRPQCPPVYDQADLGSCTGNAWAFLVQWLFIFLKLKFNWIPSRLFIYWHERQIEGDTKDDTGAAVADGANTVTTKGACPETTWPYVESKFNVCPPAEAFKEAATHVASGKATIDNTNKTAMKSALASDHPIAIGFTVYDSFMTDAVANSGIVPMPDTKTESEQGGHCVGIVGYDDNYAFPAEWKLPLGAYIIRNSWGTSWGLNGYAYVPYGYFTNAKLASDCWIIKQIA